VKCTDGGAEDVPGMIECANCGDSLSSEPPRASQRVASSDSIERILLAHIVEQEDALRELKGLKGAMARALSLPITIVYKSEVETVSHHVDRKGRVSVTRGEMRNVRVTFEGSHSSLCRMLVSREHGLPSSGHIKMTVSRRLLGKTEFEFGDGQLVNHPFKGLFWYLKH
jgi:hypothetical protein